MPFPTLHHAASVFGSISISPILQIGWPMASSALNAAAAADGEHSLNAWEIALFSLCVLYTLLSMGWQAWKCVRRFSRLTRLSTGKFDVRPSSVNLETIEDMKMIEKMDRELSDLRILLAQKELALQNLHIEDENEKKRVLAAEVAYERRLHGVVARMGEVLQRRTIYITPMGQAWHSSPECARRSNAAARVEGRHACKICSMAFVTGVLNEAVAM